MFARPFRKHGELTIFVFSLYFTLAFKPVIKLFRSDIAFYSTTGPIPLSTYMRIYKKGDIVDIKVSFIKDVLMYFFVVRN